MNNIRHAINLIDQLYQTKSTWQIIDLLEDRQQWLKTNYLNSLAQKLNQFRIPNSIKTQIDQLPDNLPQEKIFAWLASRDPTKNKQYLQWILNLVTKQTPPVPFEDLEYLPDSLAEYELLKQKNKLTPEQRDINKISTPSALDALINSFKQKTIAADAEELAQARAESKILLDNSEYLVVIPTTEFAAKFWGRGTEWCTAWGDPKGLHPKRENRFKDYNQKGPLVIIIPQDNPEDRYQLHGPDDQYKDRADEPIYLEKFAEKFKKLMPLLAEYITIFGAFTANEKLQLAAVKQDGSAIRFINDPSEAVQLAAVKEDGRAIQYIKNPSEALQLAAVKQNGPAIYWIIQKIRKDPSEEVQLAAVTKDPRTIQFIKNPSPAVKRAADLAKSQ